MTCLGIVEEDEEEQKRNCPPRDRTLKTNFGPIHARPFDGSAYGERRVSQSKSNLPSRTPVRYSIMVASTPPCDGSPNGLSLSENSLQVVDTTPVAPFDDLKDWTPRTSIVSNKQGLCALPRAQAMIGV